MDFETEFEKFKDPVGYWYKNLSEYEKGELNRIKDQYEKELDRYFPDEREHIYERFQYHLTPLAKSIELQNYDNHIRVDLDYNDAYHEVLIEFSNTIDPNKYLQFAYAYQVLEDTSTGLRVLKNILSRNIIKLCLKELEYAERNYFLPKYGNIFKDKRSEQFYFYIVNHWLNRKEKPLTILSYLYFKFSSKNHVKLSEYSKDSDFTIICNQIQYAKWFNANAIHKGPNNSYKIPKRKDTGGVSLKNIQSLPNIELYHTKFYSLKEDFLKQMHKNY